jgi:four helix bundle protein
MFVAYQVARDLIRQLVPLMPALKLVDKDFEDNLRRAANSVLHNLGEGRFRSGGDRKRFYEIAAGSVGEIMGAIDAAETWGYSPELVALRPTVDRLMGLMYGLVHSPKIGGTARRPRRLVAQPPQHRA